MVLLVPLTYRGLTDPKGDTRFYVRAVWCALVALLTLPSRGLLDLTWAEPWGSTTAGLALLFAWVAARGSRPQPSIQEVSGPACRAR